MSDPYRVMVCRKFGCKVGSHKRDLAIHGAVLSDDGWRPIVMADSKNDARAKTRKAVGPAFLIGKAWRVDNQPGA